MRDPYPVRFEWGPAGAAAAAPSSSYLVIVDVLSFSTSVTVAAKAGDPGLPLVGSPSKRSWWIRASWLFWCTIDLLINPQARINHVKLL